jgi:hypothetical protein
MWRCVDLVWADVSEERIASIFRVEKSTSLQPPSHAGSSLADFSTLKMEARNVGPHEIISVHAFSSYIFVLCPQ